MHSIAEWEVKEKSRVERKKEAREKRMSVSGSTAGSTAGSMVAGENIGATGTG